MHDPLANIRQQEPHSDSIGLRHIALCSGKRSHVGVTSRTKRARQVKSPSGQAVSLPITKRPSDFPVPTFTVPARWLADKGRHRGNIRFRSRPLILWGRGGGALGLLAGPQCAFVIRVSWYPPPLKERKRGKNGMRKRSCARHEAEPICIVNAVETEPKTVDHPREFPYYWTGSDSGRRHTGIHK